MFYKFYGIILSGIFLFIIFSIPSPSYGDGGYFSPPRPHKFQYRISNEVIELLRGKIDPEKLEFIKNNFDTFDTREELIVKVKNLVKSLNNDELWLIADYADISSRYRVNDDVLYKLKNQIDSKNLEKLQTLKGIFYKADLMTGLKKLNFSDKEIEYVIYYAGKGSKEKANIENYLFDNNYRLRGLDIAKDSIKLFYDTYLSPSQEGIISFDKGKETLIIKVPALEIPDFAWVVPVPSYPEVKKTDQLLFPLLSDAIREDLFSNKKVWYSISYSPGGGLILDGGGYSSPAPTPKPDTVKVYEKKVVGNFDTVILSAEKPEDLINWLNKNQFYFPEKAREAIEFYTKKHWYFVAMKIKNPELLNEIHPVEFTFETKQPVYPMKITSVNEGDSRVNLYIFSDRERGCPWMYRIWDGDYHKLSSVVSHIKDYPSHLTVISGKIPNRDIKDDITLDPMSSYGISNTGLLHIVHWYMPLLVITIISGIVLYLYKKKNIKILSIFAISIFIISGIVLLFYYILIFSYEILEDRLLCIFDWNKLLLTIVIISGIVLYLYRNKNMKPLNVFTMILFILIGIFSFFSYYGIPGSGLLQILYWNIHLLAVAIMYSILLYLYKKINIHLLEDFIMMVVMITGIFTFSSHILIPIPAAAIVCGIAFYIHKKKHTVPLKFFINPLVIVTGIFLFFCYMSIPMSPYGVSKSALLYTIYCDIHSLSAAVIFGIVLYLYKKKNMEFIDDFTVTLFVMTGIFLIVYYIINPNFLLARSQGRLAACESNIKNLATALEMYATDNTGTYPTQLSQLTVSAGPGGGYMKVIPSCPLATNKDMSSYIYRSTTVPDNFAISCIYKHDMSAFPDPVVFPRCGEWNIGNYSPFLDRIEIEKIKEIGSTKN